MNGELYHEWIDAGSLLFRLPLIFIICFLKNFLQSLLPYLGVIKWVKLYVWSCIFKVKIDADSRLVQNWFLILGPFFLVKKHTFSNKIIMSEIENNFNQFTSQSFTVFNQLNRESWLRNFIFELVKFYNFLKSIQIFFMMKDIFFLIGKNF